MHTWFLTYIYDQTLINKDGLLLYVILNKMTNLYYVILNNT